MLRILATLLVTSAVTGEFTSEKLNEVADSVEATAQTLQSKVVSLSKAIQPLSAKIMNYPAQMLTADDEHKAALETQMKADKATMCKHVDALSQVQANVTKTSADTKETVAKIQAQMVEMARDPEKLDDNPTYQHYLAQVQKAISTLDAAATSAAAYSAAGAACKAEAPAESATRLLVAEVVQSQFTSGKLDQMADSIEATAKALQDKVVSLSKAIQPLSAKIVNYPAQMLTADDEHKAALETQMKADKATMCKNVDALSQVQANVTKTSADTKETVAKIQAQMVEMARDPEKLDDNPTYQHYLAQVQKAISTLDAAATSAAAYSAAGAACKAEAPAESATRLLVAEVVQSQFTSGKLDQMADSIEATAKALQDKVVSLSKAIQPLSAKIVNYPAQMLTADDEHKAALETQMKADKATMCKNIDALSQVQANVTKTSADTKETVAKIQAQMVKMARDPEKLDDNPTYQHYLAQVQKAISTLDAAATSATAYSAAGAACKAEAPAEATKVQPVQAVAQ